MAHVLQVTVLLGVTVGAVLVALDAAGLRVVLGVFDRERLVLGSLGRVSQPGSGAGAGQADPPPCWRVGQCLLGLVRHEVFAGVV